MKGKVLIFLITLLLLPIFSLEGYSQKMVLKAGVAKTDITPTESLYMGGYDSNMRMDPSDGAYGKIYIRAIVFDDTVNRVAFIESNIVGYPRNAYDTIRKQISNENGIPFD